jgi:hypothetical protein
VTVEGPQAVLVSNNVYGMGTSPGSAAGPGWTVAPSCGSGCPATAPGCPSPKPVIDWKRLWQMPLTVPGTGGTAAERG